MEGASTNKHDNDFAEYAAIRILLSEVERTLAL